jgi:hypothetical protein
MAKAAASGPRARGAGFPASRTRLIVLTDIGNEPDDSQSLVRLLTYANEFEIEGLLAVTSTWLRAKVNPQMIEERVRAYGEVLPNLRVHASGWPTMEDLLARIRGGRPEYGLEGVGPDKDSDAARLIISAVDRPDPRPVWLTLWGGATDLTQALDTVRRTRSPAEVEAFTAKMRVYSISDQDDAGPWIRANFPRLFWIASVHAFSQYRMAAWQGVSADLLYPMPGADVKLVDHAWQHANIIGKGPLGALYPQSLYLMEGDTPSFLHLIPNGLGVPERPDYGGWGGRYGRVTPELGLYADAVDQVKGADGLSYATNQATVWRWREAFQNDFAARIAWSVTPRIEDATHPPEVVLNGTEGPGPVRLTVRAGETVRLSAAGSRDPDGGTLRLSWWQYGEAGGGLVARPLQLSAVEGFETTFVAPKVASSWESGEFHVILEARNSGAPPLTRYRRAVVTVIS